MSKSLSILTALCCIGAAARQPAQASSYPVYTTWDTARALDQVEAAYGNGERLRCIVWHESTNDPYAVGAQGEMGVAQLHPGGLLGAFYAAGYDDPWSPYQAVEFLASALAQGLGSHWSPVLRGLC